MLDEELFTQEEQDEVLKKLALRKLQAREVEARQRKLMKQLAGHPVVFGMVIGVVIGRVDELENVTIAHIFSQKTPTARIKWARETNAKADAVTMFDEAAQIDPLGIPVPQSRARSPEMMEREQVFYANQLKLAVAFATQYKERAKKIAAAKKRIQELETAAGEE